MVVIGHETERTHFRDVFREIAAKCPQEVVVVLALEKNPLLVVAPIVEMIELTLFQTRSPEGHCVSSPKKALNNSRNLNETHLQ